MKKTTILIFFVGLCLGTMAQDDQAKQFRPSKNNITLEVNVNPFSSGKSIFINGFRGRLFLNNKLAIRTGFNVDYRKTHNEMPEPHNNVIYYNTSDESYTTLGLNTGVEYHFLKTAWFSPYFGIIVGYENKTSKSTYNEVNYDYTSYTMDKTEIQNGWNLSYLIDLGGGYYQTVTGLTERGYSKLSANAVMGADFYPCSHLYLGLEIGLGYNAILYKVADVKVNGVFDKKYPKATENTIGINFNNAIRVGFWF